MKENELDDLDLDLEGLDLDEDTDDLQDEDNQEEDGEDDLDEIDLDLDLEELPEVTDELVEELDKTSKAVQKNKPKEASLDDDIDIDLDDDLDLDDEAVEDDVEEVPQPVEKPKSTKKSTVKKEVKKPAKKKETKKSNPKKVAEKKDATKTEEVVVEDEPTEESNVTIQFVPDFKIGVKNLDITTLQIRKTDRTKEELESLKEKIVLQGQVEPIQVLNKNGKYFLMAGAGRVICLRELELDAKALVYTGLSDEDALKISTGSNEGRLELSEWDRVHSIGSYFDRNPLISKDDESDPTSLLSVFGYNKSTIYSYLKIWAFYKKKPEFHTLFQKIRCPLYVLTNAMEILSEYADKIDSFVKVIEIIKKIVKRNDLNKKTFQHHFVKEITDFLIDIKMEKQEVLMEALEAPLDDPKLATAEKDLRASIADKMKVGEDEAIAARIENNEEQQKLKAEIEKLFTTLDKSCDSVIMTLSKISETDFQKLIPSKKVADSIKKVSKINRMVNILL